MRLFGYPQQTRNIALSNASHCASSQGLVSNQELVTVTGNGGTSVLTSVVLLLFPSIDPLIGVALNDTSASLLGYLPGNTKLDLEFRANAFPSTGTARIYKGRLTYEKKLLWLIPITRTIFNKDVNSESGDKFIENYPGGVTPNALAISENGGDNNWFYNYDYNLSINLNFNFISATSALDVGNGNAILGDGDYFARYNAANPPIGSRAIPFNNFTTSSNQNNSLNAPHISFNRRNGDWLATELDNITTNNQVFDCTYICSNTSIAGSDFLCTTSNYTAPAGGISYNWTITQGSNLVSLSANGAANISITALPNASGQVTLSLIMGGSCGTITVTKNIFIGSPDFYLDIYSTPQQPEKTFVTMTSNNPMIPIEQQGITSTTITKVSNTGSIVDIKWLGQMFVGKMDPNSTNSVTATATNACGTTTVTVNLLELLNKQADSKSINIYTVYPNPTNNLINVSLVDETQKPATISKIIAELYDFSGQPKQKVEIKNNIVSINCSGLTKGIYILKISIDGNVESHQVFVQ